MSPLAQLPPAHLSVLNRVWLAALRVYIGAVILVVYKVTLFALHKG